MTTDVSQAKYRTLLHFFFLLLTFRIGRITLSLNCREILTSSPFCTSSGEKHNIHFNSDFVYLRALYVFTVSLKITIVGVNVFIFLKHLYNDFVGKLFDHTSHYYITATNEKVMSEWD